VRHQNIKVPVLLRGGARRLQAQPALVSQVDYWGLLALPFAKSFCPPERERQEGADRKRARNREHEKERAREGASEK